jgi:hypothetical protein
MTTTRSDPVDPRPAPPAARDERVLLTAIATAASAYIADKGSARALNALEVTVSAWHAWARQHGRPG